MATITHLFGCFENKIRRFTLHKCDMILFNKALPFKVMSMLHM